MTDLPPTMSVLFGANGRKQEDLPYAHGSWGPEAAQALAGPNGWHLQQKSATST